MRASAFLGLGLIAVLVGCGPTIGREVSKGAAEDSVNVLSQVRQEVAFHQDRVKNDPKGALGWVMLSESYLKLARLTDDDEAAVEGEKAALESLKIREVNNARAAMRVTEARLHQHRFADAEDSVRMAVRLSGGEIQTIRLLGDVLLELGKYEEFGREVLDDPGLNAIPEGKAVSARWYELKGDFHGGIALLEEAAVQIRQGRGTDVPEMSWYLSQAGWMALRGGDFEQAEAAFGRALKLNSDDRKAMAGQTRLAFERREFGSVLAWANKANAIAPLTDVLGWKLMALKELGNEEAAELVYEEILRLNHLTPGEPMNAGHPHDHADGDHNHEHSSGHSHDHDHELDGGRHTHHRLLARLLADLGRELKFAHLAAEEDLKWRKDIYAYDTFSWATYLYWLLDSEAKVEGNGLLNEAKDAMTLALRTGTKDAEILSHAKEISAARPR
jgi:tetratricopeptide (TPR) repeat protein